jgi:hypothetical protein
MSARLLAALAVCLAANPAFAQEVLTELPEVELQRIPPRFSYDFGAQFGVADITYWRNEVPPWATMGLFGSWGYHPRGNDRFGPGFAAIIEGPVPLHATYSFEPTFRWDRVMGKLGLGAAVGGAFQIHAALRETNTEVHVGAAPVVAARIGWSQGWTRVGRRLFIVAEPKARYVRGKLNTGVSLQIGTCSGY